MGGGIHHCATLQTKNERGELNTKTANITPGQFKKYKKEGWAIASGKCADCKGAGTVLSNTAQVW